MQKPKDVTPIFKGEVKNGEIVFGDPFSLNHWLLKFEGKTISIKINRWAEKRTNAQNRFLWLYYRIISDELSGGETAPEYYHEYFKRIFVDAQMISVMNKTIRIPGSTTELDKYQFSVYLKKIEFKSGVPIPKPKMFGFQKDLYYEKLPIVKS